MEVRHAHPLALRGRHRPLVAGPRPGVGRRRVRRHRRRHGGEWRRSGQRGHGRQHRWQRGGGHHRRGRGPDGDRRQRAADRRFIGERRPCRGQRHRRHRVGRYRRTERRQRRAWRWWTWRDHRRQRRDDQHGRRAGLAERPARRTPTLAGAEPRSDLAAAAARAGDRSRADRERADADRSAHRRAEGSHQLPQVQERRRLSPPCPISWSRPCRRPRAPARRSTTPRGTRRRSRIRTCRSRTPPIRPAPTSRCAACSKRA